MIKDCSQGLGPKKERLWKITFRAHPCRAGSHKDSKKPIALCRKNKRHGVWHKQWMQKSNLGVSLLSPKEPLPLFSDGEKGLETAVLDVLGQWDQSPGALKRSRPALCRNISAGLARLA